MPTVPLRLCPHRHLTPRVPRKGWTSIVQAGTFLSATPLLVEPALRFTRLRRTDPSPPSQAHLSRKKGGTVTEGDLPVRQVLSFLLPEDHSVYPLRKDGAGILSRAVIPVVEIRTLPTRRWRLTESRFWPKVCAACL